MAVHEDYEADANLRAMDQIIGKRCVNAMCPACIRAQWDMGTGILTEGKAAHTFMSLSYPCLHIDLP